LIGKQALYSREMGRLLVGVLVLTILSPGCSTLTASESATPTELPLQLEIRADSPRDVLVTISEDGNGSALLDRTFTVRPGETLRSEDTLAERVRYDVSVRVEGGEVWNRTVTPGSTWDIRIARGGEIEVAAGHVAGDR